MFRENGNKKIISVFLMALIFLMPLLPAYSTENTYDFSDEAQAKFDAQAIVEQANPVVEHTKIEKEEKKKRKTRKGKKETKNNQEQIPNNQNLNSQLPETSVFQPEIQMNQNLSEPILRGNIVYIPAGATFKGVLQSSISSASLSQNDIIAAVLYSDWYYNNILIAPQGSILYGKAVDTKKAGFAYGNGSVSITFNEILTPKGESIKLESNVVTVSVESQRAKRITTSVVGGAIMGLVSGVLYALISGGDVVNGMAIGSGVGAAGGTVRAVANKGEEVEIPAGTSIDIRLIKPMNATPYNQ